MARIVGVNLPANKKVVIGLTYIFGIGQTISSKILKTAEIDLDKRVKDLSTVEIERLKTIIEKDYKVEGGLKRERAAHIKRLKDIGCYRGVRHVRHLPVRGQRTKTNSRTVRGNVRRTMASGKRLSARKV